MSKQIEALKLALEALERCVATCFDRYAHEQVMSRPEHFVNQAITALREALAEQPAQQEPVAWMKPHPKCDSACLFQCTKGFTQFPECATPQPSKPLTDEQIEQCMKQAYATVQGRNLEHAFAHAIEAKLREKNT